LGVYNLSRGDKDKAILRLIAVVSYCHVCVFLISIGTMWPSFYSSDR
jgi:hypothetical protein